MATPPPTYEHRVCLIFNPGAERGFVYTSGLACEFFALDVPVHMAKDVAGMMNFLSARAVRAEEVCQTEGNGQLYRLHAVGAKRRRKLMRTHLTQVTGTTFLQLVPIGGWAEVAANATFFVPSCACGGPDCVFCY